MNFRTIYKAALFLTVTVFSATAAGNEPPQVTVDGLHLVNDTKMARVYAKPGVDLSQYNRIYLVKPAVAFRKNWLRTQNSIPN
ncbi:MAG: hypothetical protein KJO80_14995, partial [Gammaproteobacteria bacterium]|nr:hypothetical protein [Gammaproteobacteria bacterium]